MYIHKYVYEYTDTYISKCRRKNTQIFIYTDHFLYTHVQKHIHIHKTYT